MKIEGIRIENFRCFKDETISFDNYNCFIGSNGAGKSTILNALNVFFRQYKDCQTDMSKLSKEDFHHSQTNEPIKITVTFNDLNEEAKHELANYVRLDKLIISAVANYDEITGKAEIKQFGSRKGINEFRGFFEKEKNGAKVAELKDFYIEIMQTYSDLPKPGTKDAMRDALLEYESKHAELCTDIPSQDNFYGVSRGVDKLSKFVQWVFVSATKDATKETEESKTTALGQLLERTVRSKVKFAEKINNLKKDTQGKYKEILESEQKILEEISTSLAQRLERWSHPGITAQVLWKQDAEKSVKVDEPFAYIKLGEKGFEGELARFGHGLQRSYMLALLQELAGINDESEPTLIMGIEEPEIYQHPPQARYLSEILQELSAKNSQLVICSHSPLFIPGDNIESIRLVREKGNPCSSYTKRVTYKELAAKLKEDNKVLKEEGMLAKLYPTLNPIVNEMFFCKKLIITEGIEDIAYIMTYLGLLDKTLDFRKAGAHIIQVGGKSNIIKPLAVAQMLEIPVFVVFDSDNDKQKESEIILHKKDNKKILELTNNYGNNEWPTDSVYCDNLIMWNNNLTKIVEKDFDIKYSIYKEIAERRYDQAGDLLKNPLAIAYMVEKAYENKIQSNSIVKAISLIDEFLNK